MLYHDVENVGRMNRHNAFYEARFILSEEGGCRKAARENLDPFAHHSVDEVRVELDTGAVAVVADVRPSPVYGYAGSRSVEKNCRVVSLLLGPYSREHVDARDGAFVGNRVDEEKGLLPFSGFMVGVKEILKPEEKAVVESVFEHAVYLNGGVDTLVKLITDRDYIGPASITVLSDGDLDFKSAGIREGAEVIFSENLLRAAGDGFSVDLSDAEIWNAPPAPLERRSLEEMNLNTRVLRDVIYTHPSREGLVPLLESVELLGPMQVFLKEQTQSVSERARPYIEKAYVGALLRRS